MRTLNSRWFMFGLLLGWSLTHATVFGQPASQTTDAKSVDKLRQGLERNITVDFTGGSLTEAINHIRDRSGLTISIDDQALLMMGMNPHGGDGLNLTFQVKAKDQKASTVLRKFLNTYRLCYIVFEDSLLVTAEETALMRQMRQRVSVNVEDVSVKKAIRDLAKTHGINLVIDPKVVNQADTLVSLQVDNTGIETAVRLLAELASLKAVRMGNVMFVTSEEKAKKIREEEKDQFDNPLNPNVPAGGPAVVGFGGIGMPMIQRAFPGNVGPGIPALPIPPPVADPPPPKAEPIEAPPKKVVLPVPPLPPLPPRPAPPPGIEQPTGIPAPAPRRDPANP